MPGTILPHGLQAVHLSGAGTALRTRLCVIPASDATVIGKGDPVIYTGSADAATGLPIVTKATAGGGAFISGAVVNFIAATDESPTYRAANEPRTAIIADHEQQEFVIRSSAALAVGDVNANADLALGTVNTFTGDSGAVLNQATINTTNTLQLRILELIRDARDPVGVFWSAKVRINLHTNRNLTGV